MFERIWSYWRDRTSRPRLTQFTLLGSPGVGKSTFIVFLAFFMARLNSRSVLLLRCDKGPASNGYKCVLLSQDDYCEVTFDSLQNINNDISMLRQRNPSLLFFVDGYSQADINQIHALGGYVMLATSSQFRRKSDDPTELVVLPAWQFCDLERFASKEFSDVS